MACAGRSCASVVWPASTPSRAAPRPRRWTGSRCRSTAATLSTTSRSEEHTSELQSPDHLVCRLLLEKKKSNVLQDGSVERRSDQQIGNATLLPMVDDKTVRINRLCGEATCRFESPQHTSWAASRLTI